MLSAEPSTKLLGSDERVRDVVRLLSLASSTDAPILITGESGTGKELAAREVHLRSRRSRGPFVPINCGAVPSELEESELFGYAPGAFTGAIGRKTGKFEAAHRGTLFLDEIGEARSSFQVKLLRVLQNGEYSPVGATEIRIADVRVVAATNQSLEERIKAGAFRLDLFFRLDVIRIELPALRERRTDIPLLAVSFAERYAARYGFPRPELSEEFLEPLQHYDFPGNVRELENIVHRAVITCRGAKITLDHLLPVLRVMKEEPAGKTELAFREAKQQVVEHFEREYLTTALREAAGIVSRAATRCGLSERNFHEKLLKYGIDGKSFRPPTIRT